MKQFYKYLKPTLASFLLCLFSFLAYGQERTVSGKVVDEDGITPLPGVNVVIKGTTVGTITDIEGSYSMSVSGDVVLMFSFVGYRTTEVPVGTSSVIDVTMEAETTSLMEVVVIGYGTVRKEDATGAVTAIQSEDFNKGAIISPQDLLVGRTAGVQITSNGGAPGTGSTIRIRGGSSLAASNDPLIVIDGVPVDNENISGMRNPLSAINPNDIETFSVLKDASATAIYGSRASNGVIIITTKRGAKGSKLRLSYTGNVAAYTIAKKLDVLSGDEYRALIDQRVAEGTTSTAADDLYGTENTDWQSQIYSTALGTDHNLSATGSVATMPYRASLGYTNQNGILKTSNYERFSVSLGLDPSLLEDHLQVKLNFKGSFTGNQFADEGAIGGAVTFDPTQPVYDAESVWGGYYYWPQAADPELPVTTAPANPVARLELTDNTSKVNRYIANAQVDYKFHFLPALRANLNIGTDRSNSDGQDLVPETATWFWDPVNGSGRNNQYTQEKKNDLFEFYLNYSENIESIKSKIELLGGYSWQHFWRYETTYETNTAGNYVRRDLEFKTENFLVSFYGRLNYSLMDRYLLTFTLRQDGSSRFAEDNRWGLFPSAALAWRIKEESFLASSEAISDLKLRFGYGITGQQNIGQGDYPALARVTYGQPTAQYQFGNTYYPTIRYEGYDADLKWEETTTLNAGLDFGFANDRITGSFDVYSRKTEDLLNVVPVPIGTNFTNQLLTNVGSLENKGVEMAINGFVIDAPKFKWDAGFNITANQNEITKLTLVDDPNYLGVFVGGISGGVGSTIQIHTVSYPAFSYFVYDQVYGEDGKPLEGLYIDQNEDGIINDFDRVRYEKPAPDVFMGFSSRFEYQNFDFSFNARMNLNNYVYNNVTSANAWLSNLYWSTGYLNNILSDYQESEFENAQYYSKFYVHNASFFRMDNMSVGYNLNNLGFDNMNLYLNFTVQNAFVISKYPGLDPEVDGGIDNNFYPRPRNFIFSVNLNF